MTTNDKTGGPAYPIVSRFGIESHGMTLLDYFAAKAMQGLLANPEVDLTQKDVCPFLVQDSFRIAKHMLAERERVMKELNQ